jgi:hypothetical protein
MTAARIEDLADVVSLEDAAARLGCTLDHLEMMAAAATLQVIQQPRPAVFGGGSRLVIERGELERVAALLDGGDESERESPGHVATLEWLLGALLHVYIGECDLAAMGHYEIRDFIANDLAQALEIPTTGNAKQRALYRSRETDANAIADAIKRFQHGGIYRTPEQRQRDAQIAQAKVKQDERASPKGRGPRDIGEREAA